MEKRPTLRFLAGREDAGSTPDPAAPKQLDNISKEILVSLMGLNYFIKCQKCNYKFEKIKTGVSFLFGKIDDIQYVLNGNDKKTVQLLQQQNKIHTHYSKGYSIYQCNNCHSLENICHLVLYDKYGNIIFRSESYCNQCQNLRDYIPEDNVNKIIPDLHCPICHNQDLKIDVVNLWD